MQVSITDNPQPAFVTFTIWNCRQSMRTAAMAESSSTRVPVHSGGLSYVTCTNDCWTPDLVHSFCRRFDDAMEEASELVRRNHRSLDATQKALVTGIT